MLANGDIMERIEQHKFNTAFGSGWECEAESSYWGNTGNSGDFTTGTSGNNQSGYYRNGDFPANMAVYNQDGKYLGELFSSSETGTTLEGKTCYSALVMTDNGMVLQLYLDETGKSI